MSHEKGSVSSSPSAATSSPSETRVCGPLTRVPHDTAHWLSAHVFVRSDLFGGDTDNVILDVLEPLVTHVFDHGWTDQHFFIRYGDPSLHLRIRFRGDAAALRKFVAPALLDHLDGHVCLPRSMRTTVEAPARHDLSETGVEGVYWARYNQELSRYGGPNGGVQISETVFHASSDAAFELLRGMPASARDPRIAMGVLATLIAMRAFLDEEEQYVPFLKQYYGHIVGRVLRGQGAADRIEAIIRKNGAMLMQSIQKLWTSVHEQTLVPALQHYAAALDNARGDVDAAAEAGDLAFNDTVTEPGHARRALIHSYIHMMNNRLGVSPGEEAYVARILGAFLHWKERETAVPAADEVRRAGPAPSPRDGK